MSDTTRRSVLAGAAGLTAAAALAACGDDAQAPGTDGAAPATTPARTGSSSAAPSAASSSAAAGGAAGGLAATTEIPVGSGKIFPEQKVVVTQPTKDQFKAFSAVCTHQGCTVSKIDSNAITCACHTSLFKLTDGSVISGPAKKALPAASVKVENGRIILG